MMVQHPLELRSRQGLKATQRQHTVRAPRRRRLGAPRKERGLVDVGELETGFPGPAGARVDRPRTAGALITDVVQEVVRAQPDVVGCLLRAGRRTAGTEVGERAPHSGPAFVVVTSPGPTLKGAPLHQIAGVQVAQPVAAVGRRLGTEQTVAEVTPSAGFERHRLAQERDDVAPLLLELVPLRGVVATVVAPHVTAALAPWHMAQPSVDRVVVRDADHVASEHGVEGRSVDQSLEQLQAVGDGPRARRGIGRQNQIRRIHSCSPQASSRAAVNCGEWRSGCP